MIDFTKLLINYSYIAECRKWKFLRKTTEYFISTWLLFSFNLHYEKKVLVKKELLTLQEHLPSSPSRAPSIIPFKSTFNHPLQEHLRSSPVFSVIRVARYLVFCVVFCISLFVFFIWPLYCLSFDLELLITLFKLFL
jgi:hypothetical protein